MINWFLETFPLPDQYKNEDNWNTQTMKVHYSLHLTQIGDIAEGNKPQNFKFLTILLK